MSFQSERRESPPSDVSDLQRLRGALESAERSDWRRQSGRSTPLQIVFESWLERDYLRYRADTNLLLQRLAVALGTVFYTIYIGYDWLGPQRYADSQLLWLLLVFAVPTNTALFCATLVREPWRYTQKLALVAAIANTAGMILVSVLGTLRGLPVPHELLLVQLLYDFFFLGLPWMQATVIAGLTVVVAPFSLWIAGRSGPSLFDYAFFLAVPAVLAAVACYLQERTQRLGWLRAQLLRQLSEHDPLTGIYNHRAWYERTETVLRQAQRERRDVAVLAVDVDHFKRFNDSHGHLAGDDCLRQVAKSLQSLARRPLDVVGRIGGEEFAIFLYGVTPESARNRAESVRDALRALMPLPGVRVTGSVGVAYAGSDDALTAEVLVGRADTALYRAKAEGRDRVAVWGAS